MFVDSHAHLDFVPQGLTVSDWLERAKEEGVEKIVSVGTSVDASRENAEIAEKYSEDPNRHSRESGNPGAGSRVKHGMTERSGIQIFSTVGIHAEDGKGDVEKYGSIEKCVEELAKIVRDVDSISGNSRIQNDPSSLPKLRRASSKRVVAVGEAGYDFHLVTSSQRPFDKTQGKPATTSRDATFQKKLFETQISLAEELKLPLVIHCRDAWEETFEAVHRRKIRGVFHSFAGNWESAQYALDLGFFISFSGIVTFKNAPKVQEVAAKIPLHRMLVETDSPYLSPEPFRGLGNEPKNVRIVAQFIAQLRNLPVDAIANATSQNAGRLFSI